MLKRIWGEVWDFFSDRDDLDEPVYDPAHFAAVIVLSVFAIGALFWLLWTLLVFGGGIFVKIGPALQVAFTSKTLRDFGWVGYPYELGAFEGFIGNLAALVLTLALILGLWRLFQGLDPKTEERNNNDEI